MGASQAKSAFERISSGSNAHSGMGGKRDLITAIEDKDVELLQQVVANNPSLLREVLQHANNSAQLAVTTKAHAVLERIVAYAALARCARCRPQPGSPARAFIARQLSAPCTVCLCPCGYIHTCSACSGSRHLPASEHHVHIWLLASVRAGPLALALLL